MQEISTVRIYRIIWICFRQSSQKQPISIRTNTDHIGPKNWENRKSTGLTERVLQ